MHTGKQHKQIKRPKHFLRVQQTMLGRSPGPRRKTRLQKQPSNSISANRHHRLHDGLRHNLGWEPDLPVKYKKLVGGGMIKIVNHRGRCLRLCLSWGTITIRLTPLLATLMRLGTIEGAPHVIDDHLAVFDCSFASTKGDFGRLLTWAFADDGGCAALSQLNEDRESFRDAGEDIAEAYQAWKLGLKASCLSGWARSRSRFRRLGLRLPTLRRKTPGGLRPLHRKTI